MELAEDVLEKSENIQTEISEPCDVIAETAQCEAGDLEQDTELEQVDLHENQGVFSGGSDKKRNDLIENGDSSEEVPLTRKDAIPKFEQLLEEMVQLKALFEKRLLIDEQKNQIIANQGAELQKYKDGLYEKIFKPLLGDVIEIADDLHRMIRAYESKRDDNIPATKLLSILEIYESDIEDILDKYGVNVFSCEEQEFNPKRQKIVRVIETSDASQNHLIAERVSKGFEMGDKLIKPERVNVYKYSVPEAVSENEVIVAELRKEENIVESE